MIIFINYPLYVGYSSSSQCGIDMLQVTMLQQDSQRKYFTRKYYWKFSFQKYNAPYITITRVWTFNGNVQAHISVFPLSFLGKGIISVTKSYKSLRKLQANRTSKFLQNSDIHIYMLKLVHVQALFIDLQKHFCHWF